MLSLDEFVVDAGAESAVYDGVVYTPCLGGPSRGAVLDARLLILDTRRARLEETVQRNRARNSHHRSVSPAPDLSVWRPCSVGSFVIKTRFAFFAC